MRNSSSDDPVLPYSRDDHSEQEAITSEPLGTEVAEKFEMYPGPVLASPPSVAATLKKQIWQTAAHSHGVAY